MIWSEIEGLVKARGCCILNCFTINPLNIISRTQKFWNAILCSCLHALTPSYYYRSNVYAAGWSIIVQCILYRLGVSPSVYEILTWLHIWGHSMIITNNQVDATPWEALPFLLSILELGSKFKKTTKLYHITRRRVWYFTHPTQSHWIFQVYIELTTSVPALQVLKI